MRKFWVVVLLVGLVVSTSASTLLIEAYQEGAVTIPSGENDTVSVVEVVFSIDSSCHVMFTTGGIVTQGKVWLVLDGDSLPPTDYLARGGARATISISYAYLLEPGVHTISLTLANFQNSGVPTTSQYAYLQALIFLPDGGGAVAEQPELEPASDAVTSVVSRGPYVTVTGATELVDATGRVIENAIEEDRVSINSLPQGTYFARNEERTVVKIVKVE